MNPDFNLASSKSYKRYIIIVQYKKNGFLQVLEFIFSNYLDTLDYILVYSDKVGKELGLIYRVYELDIIKQKFKLIKELENE